MITALRAFAGICGLLVVVVVVRELQPGVAHVRADAVMALGFVVVAAYLMGLVARAIKLPAITGYILAGLLFGPDVLRGFVPEFVVMGDHTVGIVKRLDGAALGLIALTAGGELELHIVRKRMKSLLSIIGWHVGLVTLGVGGVLYLFASYLPGLSELEGAAAVAACLIFGVTAVAKSPATTIAVLQEYQPKGPMTDVILAVTVAKDVVVVTLFTIALAISTLLVDPSAELDLKAFGLLAWEVFGSFGVGLLVGWLLAWFAERLPDELPVAVVGIAFLSGPLPHHYHLSGLLVCMVAGFYVENFSVHGRRLIDAVERHSLILYVVFFAAAGAGLDLDALEKTWMLALALVTLRVVFTFAATWLGAWAAGDPPTVRKYAWTGFLGQAGVTLGFASIVAMRLPAIGEMLQTAIIAAVAVNQIFGPPIFRLGLGASGELPEESES